MAWWRQRIVSFGHAFRGLGTLVREQVHARVHVLATVVVLALALWLEVSRHDAQVLVLIVCLVWLAEGMNTALEYLSDAAVPQQHPLIGKAKDVAAGTVLLTSLFAVVLAGLTFLPYI